MLRKMACAVVILGFSLGIAVAEELKGRITKIDDKSVTFKVGKDGEPKAYDLARDVKVCKMVKNEKEEVTGGVKADVFKDIPEKGLPATITVDGGKVTEIILAGGKKKAN